MLIIIRLLKYIFPIFLGYFLLRLFYGLISGGAFQWGQFGPPPPGRGPRSSTPPGRKANRNPYEVLGCSPRDSEEKIRKTYRRLVSKYHPDKFIGLDLDREFVDLAAKRFQEIQEAYESIRSSRGFV